MRQLAHCEILHENFHALEKGSRLAVIHVSTWKKIKRIPFAFHEQGFFPFPSIILLEKQVFGIFLAALLRRAWFAILFSIYVAMVQWFSTCMVWKYKSDQVVVCLENMSSMSMPFSLAYLCNLVGLSSLVNYMEAKAAELSWLAIIS